MRRTLLYLLSFCLLVLWVIGQTAPVWAAAEKPQGFSLEAELDYEKWAGKTIKDLLVLYGDLSKQASDLLKEEITIPVPPSSPISCPDEGEAQTEGKNRADFIDAFNSPELPLLQQMYDVQRRLQVLGEPAQQEPPMEFRLMGRLEKKAMKMIGEYGKDAEKVSAIASVSLNVARILELTGAEKTGSSALMPQLASMYETALNKLLKILTEEHDYGTVNTIIDFARSYQLLSGVDPDVLPRIEKALNFELEIIYKLYNPAEGDIWTAEAKFPVTYTLSPNESISGSGTGSLTSFTSGTPGASVSAPDFAVQARITEWLPCEGSAKLSLDRFYPDSELLVVDGLQASMPMMMNGMKYAVPSYMAEGGLTFPISLHNQEAIAADDTIKIGTTGGVMYSTFQIKLTHKPLK